MRFKTFGLFFISIFLIVAFSLSKTSKGFQKKVVEVFPEKIVEIIKEPTYISEVPKYITNDSLHYFKQKLKLKIQKSVLKTQYSKAETQAEKTAVLNEASEFLYSNLVDSLIPYWYGTPWDYNGISQQPGKGKIACGYFVFTLMRDAGIKLPRIKMSQAVSETAIKALVSSDKIKRYSNVSLEDFNQKTIARGNGVYIIGLDNHVGLYQVKDDEAWFLHSSVISPGCVIKEKASDSPALLYSSYRVAGKLSDYSTLTKQWLFDEYVALN